MATTSAAVVHDDALDVGGLSVATGIQSASDTRFGAIYDSVTLAGAAPIWFHSLKDGRHLMAMARSWSAGTPHGGTPGYYSAKTESLVPKWMTVDGPRGSITGMPDDSIIPFQTTVDSSTLVAGASRPPELLWLLHSAVVGPSTIAVMQAWNVTSNGAVYTAGEEVLPATATVVFDKGLQYASPYIYAYGTDDDGKIYRIRKGWFRIGRNLTRPDQLVMPKGTFWEYYTGTGWSTDITELAPVQTGFVSDGPVSFGYFRNQIIATTVEHSGSNFVGHFWTSNSGRPWTQLATTVALGSSTGTTYLGHGLLIQSQVGANPGPLASSTNAGIVYLVTKKAAISTDISLANTWGILPVTL